MKTLYLMRHGQTMFNVEHKNQGWCDAPLTELGIRQAEVAGRWFHDNGIHFDHAYASTSERACDTLEIVTGGKMPYQRLKGLKEWFFGRLEGQDSFLNPPLPFGDQLKQFGGEGEKELTDRIVSTVRSIMDESAEGETVLAVSHGAACAAFNRAFLEYAKEKYKPGIGNCAIFEFSYDGDVFVCERIITHDFSKIEKN